MGTVRTGTPRYYHVAAGSARRPSPDSFLPHRVPIVAQFARQHLLHALRLPVGKGIEPGVQIWAKPHAVTPHVRIVLDPVLVALEPRLGVEPRHPHIESRLAGVMVGIGSAEFGVLQHRGLELDHVDVVSRHAPPRAPKSTPLCPTRM